MSEPGYTATLELADVDAVGGWPSPLRLLVPLADSGGTEGEDGGGSSAPPASEPDETGTGEDGGGSSTPPAERTGTGEDGGGSSAPPAETDRGE